jgi:hypothetical protein
LLCRSFLAWYSQIFLFFAFFFPVPLGSFQKSTSQINVMGPFPLYFHLGLLQF